MPTTVPCDIGASAALQFGGEACIGGPSVGILGTMQRPERRSVILAAVLVLPSALFVAASILKYGLHISFLYDALGPFADPEEGIADAVVTTFVLLGPVAAALLALWPIVRLRVGRSSGTVEASVSLRLAWANVLVVAVALGLLVVLFGHIAAEDAACWLGNVRAC